MTAACRPLHIEQGATYQLGFTWYQAGPVVDGETTPGDPYWTDPTGIDAAMQIRPAPGSSTIILEASTYNGRITIGPNGRVDLRLEDTDTDLLTVTRARYDFEVRLNDGPPRTVRRILEGTVTVDPNTTRNETLT